MFDEVYDFLLDVYSCCFAEAFEARVGVYFDDFWTLFSSEDVDTGDIEI